MKYNNADAFISDAVDKAGVKLDRAPRITMHFVEIHPKDGFITSDQISAIGTAIYNAASKSGKEYSTGYFVDISKALTVEK